MNTKKMIKEEKKNLAGYERQLLNNKLTLEETTTLEYLSAESRRFLRKLHLAQRKNIKKYINVNPINTKKGENYGQNQNF